LTTRYQRPPPGLKCSKSESYWTSQELADKFFLPSAILENRTFNDYVRSGNLNPFQQDAIVICSYQFARKMEPYIRQTQWDLVVIDEAHRLRNVYKPTNKIANAIK
jgi:superfamily II DNA or RNA helicase